MLKPIIVFLITLLLLVPVCLFVGYGIGKSSRLMSIP